MESIEAILISIDKKLYEKCKTIIYDDKVKENEEKRKQLDMKWKQIDADLKVKDTDY